MSNVLQAGISRVAALVAALAVAWPSAAARPPAQDMQTSSMAFADAEAKLAAGDPDGAIALFEAGLGQLPADPGYAPTRARVLLTIVEAHEAAFARDNDLERLQRAKRLLDRYLGPLDLLDEQGRAAAEEQRSGLIGKITAVEATRKAEDAARAASARRDRADKTRKQARVLSLSGIALISAGIAGLALMGAGLGLGRAADRGIDELKAGKLAGGDDWDMPCSDAACQAAREQELAPLLARGNAGNVLVVVGSVTGGALLATGVALLVVGRKKKREARQLELTPAASGFGLALRGRF